MVSRSGVLAWVVYWLGILAFGTVLVGGLWLIAPVSLGMAGLSFALLIAKHGPTLRGFFAPCGPAWWAKGRTG